MGNAANANQHKMKPIELAATEYLKISTSDTQRSRKEITSLWKKYYAPIISEYSNDRCKLVAMNTLCRSFRITKIVNVKKEENESVHVEFSIFATIKYRKKSINVKLSLTFNDSVDLYDEEKYDEHWQKYSFHQIGQDNDEPIIENGTMNEEKCSQIADLFGFDDKKTNEMVRIYFDLLWQWFIGKEMMKWKNENLREKMWENSPTGMDEN